MEINLGHFFEFVEEIVLQKHEIFEMKNTIQLLNFEEVNSF